MLTPKNLWHGDRLNFYLIIASFLVINNFVENVFVNDRIRDLPGQEMDSECLSPHHVWFMVLSLGHQS